MVLPGMPGMEVCYRGKVVYIAADQLCCQRDDFLQWNFLPLSDPLFIDFDGALGNESHDDILDIWIDAFSFSVSSLMEICS